MPDPMLPRHAAACLETILHTLERLLPGFRAPSDRADLTEALARVDAVARRLARDLAAEDALTPDAHASALGWAPVAYDEWTETLCGQKVLHLRAVVSATPHPLVCQQRLTARELESAINREGMIQSTREKMFAMLDRAP